MYDAANRLQSLNGQQVYTFDDNGNLLNSDTLTNTFDAANRLVETERNSNTIQPVYNGVGDRVGQTVDGQTTNYALDVAGSLPEVIYTSQSEIYLHLPGVIVTQKATEIHYLLSDGLGSIRQVVDETATVVAYQEFDPYGNPIAGEGDPYGYTGEWWEDEVGLLHLRARWYAPETGTFLSVDPVESEPPYQYVRGNVINWVDPSGLCPPSVPECRDSEGLPIDDYYRIITSGDRWAYRVDSEYIRPLLGLKNQTTDPLTKLVEEQLYIANERERRRAERIAQLRKAREESGLNVHPPYCTNKGCKLEVFSVPVGGSPAGSHLFIVHTDRFGNEYTTQGVPDPGPANAYSGFVSNSTGYPYAPPAHSRNDYGQLTIIDYPGFDQGTGSRASESINGHIVVAEGWEVCQKKQCLQNASQAIRNANQSYWPLGPNSNSAAYTILRTCGLPVKKPGTAWHPGWGIDIFNFPTNPYLGWDDSVLLTP